MQVQNRVAIPTRSQARKTLRRSDSIAEHMLARKSRIMEQQNTGHETSGPIQQRIERKVSPRDSSFSSSYQISRNHLKPQ